MVTGDNVETARAIAFDIGLIDRRDAPIDTPDGVIMTSPDLQRPGRRGAEAASAAV